MRFGEKKVDSVALFGEAAYTDVHDAEIDPRYLGDTEYLSHQLGFSLTRDRRDEPAPGLPQRDEPDLLSLLEASGRLVADEETAGTDVSTVEEEELSALMGEKEDYNQPDEQAEEDWED
jgi:hypothetical protein